MKYIGRGQLKVFAEETDTYPNVIVWGRRLKNIRVADLKGIFKQRVVYLDTIDLASISQSRLRVGFLLSAYKIEKILTGVILKAFSSKCHQVHVPLIVDSGAWKKMVDPSGETIIGLKYRGIIKLIEIVVSNNIQKLSASEIQSLIAEGALDVDEIRVSHSFALQIVKNID